MHPDPRYRMGKSRVTNKLDITQKKKGEFLRGNAPYFISFQYVFQNLPTLYPLKITYLEVAPKALKNPTHFHPYL